MGSLSPSGFLTVLTLAAPHALEQEVKKSRFIARAARAGSVDEAQAFLESVREPKATHNCWAYKIGAEYRFSDDGEPGGTAGQPILHAIEGQGLDHVVVVVIRYFGGIKLGAGGLVRAYGGAAAECLRLAPRVDVRPRVTLRVSVPFAFTGALYPLIEASGAQRLSETYTDTGVALEVSIEEGSLEVFSGHLRDATRGKASVEVVAHAQEP
jgi:uncharacterized YigZ family protein